MPSEQFEGEFFALSNAISIPVLALLLPDVEDEEGKVRGRPFLLLM